MQSHKRNFNPVAIVPTRDLLGIFYFHILKKWLNLLLVQKNVFDKRITRLNLAKAEYIHLQEVGRFIKSMINGPILIYSYLPALKTIDSKMIKYSEHEYSSPLDRFKIAIMVSQF